jgi:pimeloyl-ACP methyl ester carboxylesterase
MKKCLAFVLTFVIFLISAQTTYAFDPFIKYAGNPLPFTTAYQNWNETAKVQPSVLLDSGVYKMWYTTSNGQRSKIAFASSNDGLNWTGESLLTINDGFDNHDPSILKTSTGYTLFFAGSPNGSSYQILSVNLTDESRPDLASLQTVLTKQDVWEAGGVSAPFVFYDNQTYYLFYSAENNSAIWSIGLATSHDGANWVRCQNNPILQSADGPSLFADGQSLYLFFHKPNQPGIGYVETKNPLSCNSKWSDKQIVLNPGPEAYDQRHMIGPSVSVVDLNGKINLYYSGLGSDNIWRINLAISNSQPITPTPLNTPTLTPTAIPTPTITPTPTPKTPIVIIPGLFASWNKDAMLHNAVVSSNDWKILSFVKEYDGLIQTLQTIGYRENEDYYIFPYDWRKGLVESATNLNNFLQEKIWANSAQKKINIVGHSLGGLVGRIWEQKFNPSQLDKLITVGSPHKGTAQVYKALEAGEIDHDNSFLWLAEKMVLMTNKSGLETDKQTITRLFPVLKDLLPTFPYIKDQKGNFIANQNLTLKNDTLNFFNTAISAIYNNLTTIAGEKGNTISGYQVEPASSLDRLLDNYLDGRPINILNKQGDYVVTSESAKEGNNIKILTADHGEIIYQKSSIKELLNNLNIQYQDSQIVERSGTKLTPALIFLIKSPTTIEVTGPDNKIYQEQDGIIFIENASSGNYSLKVKGQEIGNYTVIIGETSDTNDQWNEIEGTISKNPPSSQQDSYEITFNQSNPQNYFVDQNNIPSLFDALITNLKIINKDKKNKNLQSGIDKLLTAKIEYKNKQFKKLKETLLRIHNEIFIAIRKLNKLNEFTDVISKLENLYDRALYEQNPKEPINVFTKKLNYAQRKQKIKEELLLKLKNKVKNVSAEANVLLITSEKLQKAEDSLKQKNLNYAEILLESINKLFRLI